MDDFCLIAKLLAAIKSSEDDERFNIALVDEKALKTTAAHRDMLAFKLKQAGYIDGLCVIDDVNGMSRPAVLWERSKPYITIAGMEYIQSSDPLRAAINSLKETAVGVAETIITNTIFNL